MVQTPVHIISGFLGAGKTTAIINLLDKKPANETWAILINEFGKISIDGQTLVSASAEGTVFEIVGGCICCSAKAYFAENLEKIIGQHRFHRILIEPSGLGGIDHISDLVKQHSHLHLMPIVCVVDITMTNHPRLKKLPIYRAQIQLADLILFRKTELLELEKIDELKVQFDIDFPEKNYAGESFWDEFFLSADIIQTNSKESKFVAIHSVVTGNKENYKEFSLKVDGNKVIVPKILAELLKSEPVIIRAKGYIYTGFEWQLFNYTLTGFSTENCSQRAEGELVVIYLETEPKGFDLVKTKLENL
jgi:G3E family GTPase